MAEDWFTQNAPSSDWFGSNSPATASISGATSSAFPSGEKLKPSVLDSLFGTHIGIPSVPDLARGAGQEFYQQLHNAGDLIRQIPILGPLLDKGPSIPVPPDIAQPQNDTQRLGGMLAKGAEFIAPASTAGAAMADAPLAAKMAAQAGIAGGVGLAQGQTPGQALASGATAGGLEGITAGVWPTLKDFASRKVTPRILDSLMEVSPKMLSSGAKPGARLAQDGVIAASKDSLLSQVGQTLDNTGTALNATLAWKGAGKEIDASPVVDSALENATKRIGIGKDATFQASLANIMSDVKSKIGDMGADINRLTPLQAQQLKSTIGDSIKWTGVPYEGDLNQALLDIYRGLNDATSQAVPDAKPLLSKYQDYQVAKNSLTQSIQNDSVANLRGGNLATGNFALLRTLAAYGAQKAFGTVPEATIPQLLQLQAGMPLPAMEDASSVTGENARQPLRLTNNRNVTATATIQPSSGVTREGGPSLAGLLPQDSTAPKMIPESAIGHYSQPPEVSDFTNERMIDLGGGKIMDARTRQVYQMQPNGSYAPWIRP